MSTIGIALTMVIAGVVAFGLSLLVPRFAARVDHLDPAPWSASLSYVAAAYGVIIGFSIVFLFGEYSNARQAIGDEATSVGTAFDEILLFPDDAPEVQQALICYATAVVDHEWDAMADGGSAPEVDRAYKDVILSLGDVEEPADGTFQPAAATNTFVQVGDISTARETRLVAAEVHTTLWGLIFGGGALVIGILFVAFPLALTISRYIWKRSTSAPAPALSAEQTRRFDRLEQSVDAIAIEIERISENQRYLTRVLADSKQAASVGSGSAVGK